VSGAWIDRIAVGLILCAAAAYLLRRTMQRIRVAFGRETTNATICGTQCGCGDHSSDGMPSQAGNARE
jgi:transketolase C-terminal domain/subunit